jgi:double-strand break repair protein MRE11
MSAEPEAINEGDIFNIMITTDNHLGFKENDRVRQNDSFYSFEETLKIASKANLDFMLMGGDLFHDHKPSRKTFCNTQNIFNDSVFGEQNINFETD